MKQMKSGKSTMPGFTADMSLFHGIEQAHSTNNKEYLTIKDGVPGRRNNSIFPALSIYVDGVYYCEGVIDMYGNVRCYRRGGLYHMLMR
jgi:hypothetical protein